MRVLVAALLALAAAGCSSSATPQIATPPTGTAAALPACPAPGTPSTAAAALPDLSLTCLGGGPSTSLRRLTGTPTVLNLWASWCAPCKEELPAFADLARSAAATVRVVGVASLDAPGASRSFAADAGLPFPSYQDKDGDLLRGIRRSRLPATVLVRADGSVADVYQGVPLTDATLRALVRDKLGVDV
jgi:cytochrome c biogenesis protein CcmG, thiol:disulfide interchange protein DsbE